RATGAAVRRALLDDFAAALPPDAPVHRGELLGARTANLLAGVWSTRMPQKLRNRRCETELEAWAEPWAALGHVHGAPDERPALRAAWRELLRNQAHDSICGCSQDAVHRQMEARYDACLELARETATRALERIAGLDVVRRVPWADALEIAVFNPSPHPRTDVVRFALSPARWLEFRDDGGGRQMALHPLLLADLTAPGFSVDGAPARVIEDDDPARIRLVAERVPRTVELIAADVPAFGWRRFRLAPGPACDDVVDDGRDVAVEGAAVHAADDGTLDVTLGGRTWRGLAAVEDVGDRGDSYDFDPVPGEPPRLVSVAVVRARHPSGLASLRVRRVLEVPAASTADRRARSEERVALALDVEARVVPGVARVELAVRLDNRARDHRLRLLFPTGTPVGELRAATTFDVACRSTTRRDDRAWVHPAPTTFPQQGFVAAAGLTVAAPGLPEAEVTPDGTIAITLVRAIGWLARMDLKTRPQVAGPTLPTPDAQCLTEIAATLALLPGCDPRAVRDAETGLRAVAAGPAPLLPPDRSMLVVEPAEVLVSALEPAADGRGIWLRLLNPHDTPQRATLRLGLRCASATPLRLDGTPCGAAVPVVDGRVECEVPAHALRTLHLV
ncbi:hypothetical protein K2Z84_08270, partial [Candidatus Binatia bacterium]|nr:hypothetical protein [Candidatus Binatia bacterium]